MMVSFRNKISVDFSSLLSFSSVNMSSQNKISADINSQTNSERGSYVKFSIEREAYETHKTYQRDEIKGPAGHVIRKVTSETDTRTGKHNVTETVFTVSVDG
ncbi:hypothetical protein Bhyg_04917 [Pseudolycoriella hygida]|uniref:Uncharacterized protein n=1 Tax=Pseudolycoriella hygida TaxID=35572 RepID=A0A9Q0NGH9_9DIPT|nr:hypothetical protein Bhyg_04917 [Pseudolycoriella hygida]